MPGRELTIAGKSNQGYGVIDMEMPWNYRPWIRSQHIFRGNGRRHIITDLVYPKRRIHLFSDLELNVYYMLRRNKQIKELFEQYPLDLGQTSKICVDMSISHPRHPITKEKIVMTTDFVAVVSIKGNHEFRAYAVKTTEELKDNRVQEKLKVEQLYWTMLQIPWCVITEQDICQ